MVMSERQKRFEQDPINKKMKSLRTMMASHRNRGNLDKAREYEQQLIQLKIIKEKERTEKQLQKLEMLEQALKS